MKVIFILLCAFFVPVFSVFSDQSTFSAVVTKIIDGDSVILRRGKKIIEVRLYGIDCPEWNQDYSVEARNHTSSLIYKEKVTVIPQYYDSYGRLVALLLKNGQDINGALVKSGIAWVYPRYCRKNVCQSWLEEQQFAKDAGRGLWGSISPVSPWMWKRRHD